MDMMKELKQYRPMLIKTYMQRGYTRERAEARAETVICGAAEIAKRLQAGGADPAERRAANEF